MYPGVHLKSSTNCMLPHLDYGYVVLNLPENKLKHKLSLIKQYKPLSFCLNDWPDNNQCADTIIMNFLTDLFPEKSSYEK